MIQLSDQSTRINDPKIPKQIITFSPNSNLLLFLQWTPRYLLSMWSFVAKKPENIRNMKNRKDSSPPLRKLSLTSLLILYWSSLTSSTFRISSFWWLLILLTISRPSSTWTRSPACFSSTSIRSTACFSSSCSRKTSEVAVVSSKTSYSSEANSVL